MAQISVAEAADRLGVNVQRVHQRIADGSLPAERVGHQWVIDQIHLERLDTRPAGRPLSAKSAWLMVRLSVAGHAERDRASTAAERSLAQMRLNRLLLCAAWPVDDAAGVPDAIARQVRVLMRSRAQRHELQVSPRDLSALRGDSRIRLAGLSRPDSGIASGDIVEAYVSADVMERLLHDYLLVTAGPDDANVVLHEVDPTVASQLDLLLDSWLVLAADLAEHQRPREVARAAELVREAADSGSAHAP